MSQTSDNKCPRCKASVKSNPDRDRHMEIVHGVRMNQHNADDCRGADGVGPCAWCVSQRKSAEMARP